MKNGMLDPNAPEPKGSEKERLEALLEDLESSIASFDSRLANLPNEKATVPGFRQSSTSFPEINPEAHRRPGGPAPAAKTEAKPVAGATPAPTTDLLNELAREAEVQSKVADQAVRQQADLGERLDRGLRNVFEYLHQFSQHVNVLKPLIPVAYALDYQHRFDNVHWQDGFVDYRTASLAERAYFKTVSLRLSLMAENPLIVLRGLRQEEGLRKELHLLNVTIKEEGMTTVPGYGNGTRFVLSPEIPVQMHFIADSVNGRIVIRSRNVCGFGLAAFVAEPEAFSRPVLDAIGRCLLGRVKQMPAELKPVPFHLSE